MVKPTWWSGDRRDFIRNAMAYGGLAGVTSPVALHAAGRETLKCGMSPTRLSRIKPAMDAMVTSKQMPGMVGLIYRHGTIADVTLAGWQNIEAGIAMKRDTIFQIMSMTKPITAAAVLLLVDEGQIDLYDRVDKYLPELGHLRVLRSPTADLSDVVPLQRPITIDDLLTYRSGIASTLDTAAAPLTKRIGEIYRDLSTDSAAWLKAVAALPLSTQPGTTWAYGTASEVLSILVQRVAGMPFGEFLRRRIFDPLGMNDTAHFVPPAKRARLATLYRFDPASGAWVAMPATFPDSPPAFPFGAFGLASTVDDYLLFARMLLGHGVVNGVRILSHRAVTLMTSNHLTAAQRAAMPGPINPLFRGKGWGLGIAVVVDPAQEDENYGFASLGTFTWPGAFGTWWQADPQEDMIQIYMQQVVTQQPSSPPRALFQRMGYYAIED